MGILTKLLGASPRVAVVEAFAENSDEVLSVPEIVRITGVSKRAVYIHVRKLLKDGMLVMKDRVGKCDYYQLNKTDPRGKAVVYLADVMAMGQLESEIGRDEGLELGQPFPLPRLFRPELFGVSETSTLLRTPPSPRIREVRLEEQAALSVNEPRECRDRRLTVESISPQPYHSSAANEPIRAENEAGYERIVSRESDVSCLRGQVTLPNAN